MSEKFNRQYAVLTPAYGRDYKSAKAAIDDFEKEKDFTLQPEGQYINKQQIEPGTTIVLRYNQLRTTKPHKVK